MCQMNNENTNKNPPSYESGFSFGGSVGFKAEHSHRGMKFGIALHVPDNWGRQLAAGGNSRARTCDLTDVNRAL